MATQTTHYNFPKYEATDLPNLLDQYNNFADAADTQLYTMQSAVTTAQTAATNAQTAADKATSGITTVTDTANATAALVGSQTGTGTVFEQLQTLNSNAVPTNHASNLTTYGVGSSTNYGHLKISDSASTSGSTTALSVVGGYNIKQTADTAASTATQAKNTADTAESTLTNLQSQLTPTSVVQNTNFSITGGGSVTWNLTVNKAIHLCILKVYCYGTCTSTETTITNQSTAIPSQYVPEGAGFTSLLYSDRSIGSIVGGVKGSTSGDPGRVQTIIYKTTENFWMPGTSAMICWFYGVEVGA